MQIAEYVKDGQLVRVYSENGKRTVIKEPYKKSIPIVKNGYIPRRRSGNGN